MSRRILTIDDSDVAQDVIRATLTDFGFDDVVSYLDPTEALGAITAAETSADLILLDIMMPEMDGIELCARIRGLDKWTDVPIIMLTSRKDMESLTEAFLAGANDYVTKPFERLELQARIRSSLRLKSELDRRQASDRRADAIAPARFTGAMSGAAPRHDVGLMCGQAGLLSSLLELPEDRVRTLGLAAFHVGRSDAGGDLGEDGPDLVRAAAGILGRFEIAAGDLFAHWDGGFFCLASSTKSETALVQLAERFLRDFGAMSEASQRSRWTGSAVLSAGVVPPGGATTVATRLGDAIRTCERARTARPGNVLVFSPDPEGA